MPLTSLGGITAFHVWFHHLMTIEGSKAILCYNNIIYYKQIKYLRFINIFRFLFFIIELADFFVSLNLVSLSIPREAFCVRRLHF
jgi:hypothetical protein